MMILPEVLPLRHASRELVRELGFLQGKNVATNLSHSHCHTLMEIELRGSVGVNQGELPAILRLDKSTTSRIVAELESRRWIRAKASDADGRARVLSLTSQGRSKVLGIHRDANTRVQDALRLLGEDERSAVVRGMQIYARALERARRRALYTVAPIAARDRAGVARLIRTVMPEFGAKGPGFAILDPEVDDMYGAYRGKRSAYWVITRVGQAERSEAECGVRRGRRPRRCPTNQEDDGEVVGGGGFAPLVGGGKKTTELRKMYLLSELRGLGLGQELLNKCLEGARHAGFSTMYLETLGNMTQAKALYERNGFRKLDGPLGNTGHFGCNAFYSTDLTTEKPKKRAETARK